MRILIVNKFARFTGGGAELHCVQLAALLREHGHQVSFLATHDPSGDSEREGRFVPLTVSHADRDHAGLLQGLRIWGASVWNRDVQRAATALIDEFRPDVVHAHKLYPQLSAAPVVVARRRGVPVVQTLHDYELISASAIDDAGGRIDRDESAPRFRALNTATYPVRRHVHAPRVSAWVAVSQYVAGAYRRHGIEARAIPNFTLLSGAAKDAPGFEDREGALFAGRLTSEKGVEHVLDAAELLGPRIPVTVVGDGALSGLVERRARELPNLTFVGPVSPEEVAAELRGARVALIPSRWEEPGPLIALEAMANGTPIVAYARGGLTEYVREGSAGLVCDEESPQALDAAVRALHDDPEAWALASASGRRAASTEHAPSRYVERIEEVYRGVIGE